MKKIGVLVFISFLLLQLTLQFSLAQETPIQQLPEGSEDIAEKIAKPEEFLNETKWDYLGKEWKNILLKNKVIALIDSFFKKISIVFRALFGMPYSLSMTLFFVIILWLFVFIFIGNLFSKSGIVKTFPAYLIGLAPAVIISQLQILNKIVVATGTFIVSREAKWARIVLTVVAILVLILLFAISKTLSKYLEKQRKVGKEKEAEHAQEKIVRFEKGLEETRK